jgi:hypothetical protein
MIQTDNRKRKRKGEMEVCPQKESFPGDKGGQDANKNTGKTHQLMTESAPSKGSSSLSQTLVLTSAFSVHGCMGPDEPPGFAQRPSHRPIRCSDLEHPEMQGGIPMIAAKSP